MRGVRHWDLILKRLSHLRLSVLSAIHGMSAIWNVRYWEVSLYNNNNIISKTLLYLPNHVAIPKKIKQSRKHKKQQQNKQIQQQHIIAPVYITSGDAIRQLFWMKLVTWLAHKKTKDWEINKYTYLRGTFTAQSNIHGIPFLHK